MNTWHGSNKLILWKKLMEIWCISQSLHTLLYFVWYMAWIKQRCMNTWRGSNKDVWIYMAWIKQRCMNTWHGSIKDVWIHGQTKMYEYIAWIKQRCMNTWHKLNKDVWIHAGLICSSQPWLLTLSSTPPIFGRIKFQFPSNIPTLERPNLDSHHRQLPFLSPLNQPS